MRLIVDLPVSVASFNQKIHLLWESRAQSLISASKSILVSRWHKGSDWLEKESKAASCTEGSFVSAMFISILWLASRLSSLKIKMNSYSCEGELTWYVSLNEISSVFGLSHLD